LNSKRNVVADPEQQLDSAQSVNELAETPLRLVGHFPCYVIQMYTETNEEHFIFEHDGVYNPEEWRN